ncbi:MAG: hypothetical protein O3C05_02000 [Proteobacteria bacterium]|nr:hypothetical protein [Pseudomonadota bacterium]
MITIKLQNKYLAIVIGLGITGRSTAEALLYSGFNVIGLDDSIKVLEQIKQLPEFQQYIQNKSFKALQLNDYKAINWSEVEYAVISPGIALKSSTNFNHIYLDIKKFNIKILSDLELLQIAAPKPIYIGIPAQMANLRSHHLLRIHLIVYQSKRNLEEILESQLFTSNI